jgi:hypothetical protein
MCSTHAEALFFDEALQRTGAPAPKISNTTPNELNPFCD